jgi:hypothetical protein
MSSLLIGCSAQEAHASPAISGPSWWARLARLVVDEYRTRRAMDEMRALDDRTLRDLSLGCWSSRWLPLS